MPALPRIAGEGLVFTATASEDFAITVMAGDGLAFTVMAGLDPAIRAPGTAP
jgi:hypothetical protein